MTPPRHEPAPSACPNTSSRRCSSAPPRKARARALSDVGLGGKDAVLTIHDMRSLIECIQFVRRIAVQTAVHVVTTGALIALLTGIAMKLLRRRFGFGLARALAAVGRLAAEANLLASAWRCAE